MKLLKIQGSPNKGFLFFFVREICILIYERKIILFGGMEMKYVIGAILGVVNVMAIVAAFLIGAVANAFAMSYDEAYDKRIKKKCKKVFEEWGA